MGKCKFYMFPIQCQPVDLFHVEGDRLVVGRLVVSCLSVITEVPIRQLVFSVRWQTCAQFTFLFDQACVGKNKRIVCVSALGKWVHWWVASAALSFGMIAEVLAIMAHDPYQAKTQTSWTVRTVCEQTLCRHPSLIETSTGCVLVLPLSDNSRSMLGYAPWASLFHFWNPYILRCVHVYQGETVDIGTSFWWPHVQGRDKALSHLLNWMSFVSQS